MQRLPHIDRRILAAGSDSQERLEFVLGCGIGGGAFEDDFDGRDWAAFVIADLGVNNRKEQQAVRSRQQAEKQKAPHAFRLFTSALCFLSSAFCLLLHVKISSGT